MTTSLSCALEVEGVGLLIYRCIYQARVSCGAGSVGGMKQEMGPANAIDLEKVKHVFSPMSGVGPSLSSYFDPFALFKGQVGGACREKSSIV